MLVTLGTWRVKQQTTTLHCHGRRDRQAKMRVGEVWRHITMVAKCLDHDDRCDSSKNGKKATALDWQNNNFAVAAFCTFLGRRCTTATWNFLIAHAHFIEYVNETLTFSSFSKLKYSPFGVIPRKFCPHLTN